MSRSPISAQSPLKRPLLCHPLPCPLSMGAELGDSCQQRQLPVSEHCRWGQDLSRSGPLSQQQRNQFCEPAVPSVQPWPLVFWFQVFLLFSESVFMRSKSTNKKTKQNKKFLWEYSLASQFLSGVYTSGLFVYYFLNPSDSPSLQGREMCCRKTEG